MTAPTEPFDYGREPGWSNPTPHPACKVTVEQYPQPRRCAVDGGLCRLGHPANCRWLADSLIAERATP